MSEDCCDHSEDIIRAIHTNFWNENILSTGVYKSDQPISVNRLKILNLEQIAGIIKRDLGNDYVCMAKINVGDVVNSGAELNSKLSVIPKSVNEVGKENPAHAEIIGKITDGIAKRLRKYSYQIFDINCNSVKDSSP